MKIIDILNKKANGNLKDGFKFCFENKVYIYNKSKDEINKGDTEHSLGGQYRLEKCLNDEVLLFQEEIKESEKVEKNKETEEFTSTVESYHSKETICQYCNAQTAKINELVRAVNKLNKESEEK